MSICMSRTPSACTGCASQFYRKMYTPVVALFCSITKRDADILYMGLRKIHYNVMRFKDTMTADEADALAGRVAAQHHVLHDIPPRRYLPI